MVTKEKIAEFKADCRFFKAKAVVSDGEVGLEGTFRSSVTDIYFGFPTRPIRFELSISKAGAVKFSMPERNDSFGSNSFVFPHSSEFSTRLVTQTSALTAKSKPEAVKKALIATLEAISEELDKSPVGAGDVIQRDIGSIGIRAIAFELKNAALTRIGKKGTISALLR